MTMPGLKDGYRTPVTINEVIHPKANVFRKKLINLALFFAGSWDIVFFNKNQNSGITPTATSAVSDLTLPALTLYSLGFGSIYMTQHFDYLTIAYH